MIDREYVLSLIAEMAEQDGLTIRDFVEELYAKRSFDTDIGDDNFRNELEQARAQKRVNRYEGFEKAVIERDIAEFRRFFPDVSPDSIPQSVWEKAIESGSLAGAYALYKLEADSLSQRAELINSGNNAKSAADPTEGDGVILFTKNQVESMKPSEIKKHYKSIVKSMKKW